MFAILVHTILGKCFCIYCHIHFIQKKASRKRIELIQAEENSNTYDENENNFFNHGKMIRKNSYIPIIVIPWSVRKSGKSLSGFSSARKNDAITNEKIRNSIRKK